MFVANVGFSKYNLCEISAHFKVRLLLIGSVGGKFFDRLAFLEKRTIYNYICGKKLYIPLIYKATLIIAL
jgi:hypothetical protein